jgi:DNA-binding MarR family transcriptional regulator
MQKFAKAVFLDEKLSWSAKGVMAYLFSLDDIESASMKELIGAGPSGRDAVINYVKELEEAGYIKRECRNERGRFVWSIKILENEFFTDAPLDNPGYIFILEYGELFKIGKTNDVKILESSLSDDSEILHVIESTDHEWAEKQLRKRFEKKLVKDGWYSLSGPDIEWLTSKQRLDRPI